MRCHGVSRWQRGIRTMTKSKGAILAAILISALLSASAPSARAQDAHQAEGVAPAQTGVAGSVATGKEADTAQQDMMGMMSGGMMPHRGMLGSRNMMLMKGMMAARHLEGRLAFLKTELKITDEQTPQWNAFADTVRTNATA